MTSRFILPFADVGSGIKPSSGAKLFFYADDGVTPKDTYSDQLSTPTPNSNPVIANSVGVFGDIFISGSYKVTLQDKNGSQIFGGVDVDEYAVGNFETNLINDLSQAYIFDTVALYKASTILFPVGKTIHLNDRNADFTVISGAGTGNDLDIIANTNTSQSVSLIKAHTTYATSWGADSSGLTDSHDAMQEIVDQKEVLKLEKGDFLIDSNQVFSSTKPVWVKGEGHATNIVVGASNTDNTAFRFEAIGGGFGDAREITKVSDLNFQGQGKTGIDCQAVFPIVTDTVRYFGMGQEALKLFQCYYGRHSNAYFVDSGMHLTNVNNMAFSGGDMFGIASSPNYGANDYACLLDDCDRITFDDMTLEAWRNPIIRAIGNKALHFRDTWFESNRGDHVLKLESCQDVTFSNNYMELSPGVSNAFIIVDNSDVVGVARTLHTELNVRGGYLRLSTSTSGNFKFVDIENAGTASVGVQDLSIRSGSLLLHEDCVAQVRNVTLSTTTGATDEMKFLESIPVANIAPSENNWLTESEMSDKGMSGGAIVTDITSGGSSAVISTDAFTNQNGISTKVVIPSTETDEVTLQRLCSDLTTITTEGETYIFFVRVYCSENIPIQFIIAGNILNYQVITPIVTKNKKWIDYVIKTDSSQTWALGKVGSQKLKILLTNNSGNDVDFYIDRIDYKVKSGDHYLP